MDVETCSILVNARVDFINFLRKMADRMHTTNIERRPIMGHHVQCGWVFIIIFAAYFVWMLDFIANQMGERHSDKQRAASGVRTDG